MINFSKEALPILGFNYGYITYESQKAQITIGPMECTKKYAIANFTGTYIMFIILNVGTLITPIATFTG